MRNKIANIFWDMDGTLFEFRYGGDIYSKGYFESLQSHEKIVEAAERVDGMRMVDGTLLKSYVLSSYLIDSPNDVLEEKNKALDRETHFSKEQRLFLPCGSSKWATAQSLGLAANGILIDDYGINIADWNGPYIKVSKDAEDARAEMKRHSLCISPEHDVEAIVNTICYAVENIALAQ